MFNKRVAVFFELAKRFSSSNFIKNVTIIGGGLMGSGIAQVAAQANYRVTILDLEEATLDQAKGNILKSLDRVAKKLHKDDPDVAKKFVENTMLHISVTTDLPEAVKDSDLVIEAAVENLELKQNLFKTIDSVAPAKTILATNTSSLSVGDMASVTKRKDKFAGLHFFSPVPLMKLLEVVRIPDQSDTTYQQLMDWGKSIGKTCVTCKDTPGFIVNRLLVPYVAEAVRMLERGDASAEDIDIAMKLGAGYPMGPLELADFTGLDIGYAVLEGWHKRFPDNPLFMPIETQRKLVKEGKLGRKTGEGFYKYIK